MKIIFRIALGILRFAGRVALGMIGGAVTGATSTGSTPHVLPERDLMTPGQEKLSFGYTNKK